MELASESFGEGKKKFPLLKKDPSALRSVFTSVFIMATSCLLYSLALNCLEHVKKTLVEAPQKLSLFKRGRVKVQPA